MKVPAWLMSLAVGAILALEGWQLSVLFQLRADVSSLAAKLEMHMNADGQKIAAQFP